MPLHHQWLSCQSCSVRYVRQAQRQNKAWTVLSTACKAADLVFEIIVGKFQTHNLIMETGQEVVKALQLHALLAILPKEV